MTTAPESWNERLVKLALIALTPLVLGFITLHVLWGLLAAHVLFPVLPAGVRDFLVRLWARGVLLALGIRVRLHHDPLSTPLRETPGSLLLINHTSWVDVFVVASVMPTRFVAKAEISRWTLLGKFAGAIGTIYVERGKRHAVAHVNAAVVERLRARQTIGIFPEGTTTDGSVVLRFHANMVQAALEAGAPVYPIGLQYCQDERPTKAAAFIGDMTMAASLWQILMTPRLTVNLHWLPALDTAGHTRHAIADAARTAVVRALQLEPSVSAVAMAKAGDSALDPQPADEATLPSLQG